MSTTKVNIRLFDKACALTVTTRRMGNRRQGDMKKVATTADKERLRLSKELIVADELDKIVTFQNELYKWVTARSNSSFFKSGIYLVKNDQVDAFETQLREATETLRTKLVPALIRAYPKAVETARAALGDQFNLADYADITALPGLFSIEWNWIAFTVPDALPEELRRAEADKLQKTFRDAEEQIVLALRKGFADLVDHAVERLKGGGGPDDKKKVFRDTLVTNIQDFIQTFNARDLMNDEDLKRLIERAQVVLGTTTPDDLRQSELTRDRVATQFEEIKKTLDSMIVDKATRKFDFNE